MGEEQPQDRTETTILHYHNDSVVIIHSNGWETVLTSRPWNGKRDPTQIYTQIAAMNAEQLPHAFRYALSANNAPTLALWPLVPANLWPCIIIKTLIDGHKALMMLDTGSTSYFVSPAFTTIHHIHAFPLEQQFTLQLGCVGSHSCITHGANAQVHIGAFNTQLYSDVANIDCYDCILGIPFLQQNAVIVDFGQQVLHIGWGDVPMIQDSETMTACPTRVRCTVGDFPWNNWLSTSAGDGHKSSHAHMHTEGEERDNCSKKKMPKETLEDATSSNARRLTGIQATKPLTEEDIPWLREQWFQKYSNVLGGALPELLSLQEVNHRIPLIDKWKRYMYHLPRCPDSLQKQLSDKIQQYMEAGGWDMKSTPQAAPMLCIPKKNGKLRTVVDCWHRNDNTIKDITLFPNQDWIRMDVTRAKYHSKFNLSNAYEQVRVELDNIWKTAFATIFRTFISQVMQQGGCNAPVTFQHLMTVTFCDQLGWSIHVYLDNVFAYSNTIEEHEEHLGIVFELLRKFSFYLEINKCDLYAERMDCLGHIIDNDGIHTNVEKMSRIRGWRTPWNLNEVQKFVGLVEYLAQFMPDISAYTMLLTGIQRNGHPFQWRDIHETCFQTIKVLACKYPILRPIDPLKLEPIWLICDTLLYGIGSLYGQGPKWKTCRPAGFMSKKLTNAQQNYWTFEQEMLAIIEVLLKWEGGQAPWVQVHHSDQSWGIRVPQNATQAVQKTGAMGGLHVQFQHNNHVCQGYREESHGLPVQVLWRQRRWGCTRREHQVGQCRCPIGSWRGWPPSW